MSEDRQNKWTDIKQEISDMTDLLSRNLGKNRKTPNCKYIIILGSEQYSFTSINYLIYMAKEPLHGSRWLDFIYVALKICTYTGYIVNGMSSKYGQFSTPSLAHLTMSAAFVNYKNMRVMHSYVGLLY